MKKLFTLIIVFLAINSVMAQGCLPEGITFTTQEQIDNFQTDYPGCTEIEGDVTISGVGITNLIGLNVLNSINGSLAISNNNYLTSLYGLENIISVQNLYIYNNTLLSSISGLENLSSTEHLNIEENSSLINLSGLENISSIDGIVTIYNNAALTSLSGLDNLTSVGGFYLQIEWNSALVSLSALGNLSSIGGDLYIKSNAILKNLNGMENLSSIGGAFEIVNNNDLTSLSGMENLFSVGWGLLIEHNNSLTNLNGLENLFFIEFPLRIEYNDALTSISGLKNIDPNSISSISVNDNKLLSTCHIQSICDYLAMPGSTTDIHDNAPGCNSREEVESACQLVGLENIIEGNEFSIYPNPSSNRFTIQFNLENKEQVKSLVLNNLGQVVATIANETFTEGEHELNWNAEGMPSGVYFYNIQIGNQAGTGKMVLMK